VKPVGKVILIIVSAVVVLAALGVLFMNLYVQSAKTHARIERRLGAALQMPLKISRATYTPWSGLQIAGITVPQSNPPGTGNFLEAPSFTARLRFWPLFQRRLIIDEITLTEPKVVWFENDRGQWKPPAPPKEAEQQDHEPVAAETPTTATETPSPAVERNQEQTRLRPFEVLLNQLQIKHGSFDFFDRTHNSIASFADVNVQCPGATQDLVKGSAKSSKVSIFQTVFAQNLTTSFAYSQAGDLALTELATSIAGGSLRGSFQIKTNERDSPYFGDVQFEGVDFNQLIVEAGGQAYQATGTIKGYLDLSGLTRNGKTASGRGGITLSDGQIKEYEFLQMLGQALQIEELVQLKLQQAQLDFRIDDGKIWIDQLILQSQNLSLGAQGFVKLDGKMELHARLSVNPRISRKLPSFVTGNFKPVENSDMRSLDFDVTGTISKPRTNIVQRMLGSQIEKQAVDLLQSIFGRKNKDVRDDKKKTKDKAAPTATPAASPAPPAEPGATQ
jgi:uncharacterized protein involved in outer membrane biogenesis